METVLCLKRDISAFLRACLGMGASLCLLHNANLVPMAENALPSLVGPGGEAAYTSGFLPALAPQAEAGWAEGWSH